MCSQDGNKVLKTAIQTQLSVIARAHGRLQLSSPDVHRKLRRCRSLASARRVSLVPRHMCLGTRLAPGAIIVLGMQSALSAGVRVRVPGTWYGYRVPGTGTCACVYCNIL